LSIPEVERAVRSGARFACSGGWADVGREFGCLTAVMGRRALVALGGVPGDGWLAMAAAIGARGGLTSAGSSLVGEEIRRVELDPAATARRS
jgi:hypothetical protein